MATSRWTDHIVIPRAFSSRYPYSESGEWPGGQAGSYLEPIALLGFLAGQTTTARLLVAVMVLPYRAPVFTAKTMATVDVLSGGRLTLGVGVGWLKEEFEAVGAPPFAERGRISDEYIRIFRELWANDSPAYDGDYASFSDVIFLPKPVQKPYPPIWIGGESGPALRRAGRLGDGWLPIGNNPKRPLQTAAQFRAAAAEVRQHAEEAGRDPADVDLIYMTGWRTTKEPEVLADGTRRILTGAPADIAEDIAWLRAEGVGDFILQFISPTREETLDHMVWFAEEVVPVAGA